MNDDLKFFVLAPLFAVFGALATAAAWQLFAATLLGLVPPQLAVLACLVAGLGGPILVWAAVWIVTRRRHAPRVSVLRRSASVGLGLVLAVDRVRDGAGDDYAAAGSRKLL